MAVFSTNRVSSSIMPALSQIETIVGALTEALPARCGHRTSASRPLQCMSLRLMIGW